MTRQHRQHSVEAAHRHLQDCQLCPHRCGTLRRNGSGVCGVRQTSYIASEMLHMGEERLLRPAHAIFFSGCTAQCAFCIAARYAFNASYGVAPSASDLADRMRMRQREGARSICFIGGDPVPHLPMIIETLEHLGQDRTVPTVLNSNFYMTKEAVDLVAPYIDVCLPDLKFGKGECGERLGTMPGYWNVVTSAIDRMAAMGKPVIVRHLLMPGHTQCCSEAVLTWLAARPNVELSLLDQYVPPANNQKGLPGRLTDDERQWARKRVRQLGLKLAHE